MFKITNNQLIQIAAVDAGLDPFAEYCTKGVYKAAGYTVKTGCSIATTSIISTGGYTEQCKPLTSR